MEKLRLAQGHQAQIAGRVHLAHRIPGQSAQEKHIVQQLGFGPGFQSPPLSALAHEQEPDLVLRAKCRSHVQHAVETVGHAVGPHIADHELARVA